MRKVLLTIIIVLMAFMINLVPAYARDVKGIDASGGSGTVTYADYNCGGVFGSTSNPEDFAYYLQGAFNIMKFLGPILVVLMSIIDLVKITAEQKQDDQLIKLGKKTLTRAIYAVLLFILPDLLNYIFGLVGLYGTCGIN